MELRKWTLALLLTGIMLPTGIAQAIGDTDSANDLVVPSEADGHAAGDAGYVVYVVDGEVFGVPVAEVDGTAIPAHSVPASCHGATGCEGVPYLVDESGDTMSGPLVMEADLVISDHGEGSRLLLEEGTQGEVHDGGRFLFRTGSELSFEDGVVFDFPEEMGAIFKGISEIGNTEGDSFAVLVGNHSGFRLQAVDDSLGHNGNVTPGVIGGHPDNWVAPGVAGATIGGGGNTSEGNQVLGDYGTVGGGVGNIAGSLPGGSEDRVEGLHHITPNYSTVGGGFFNFASGWSSTVAGGHRNWAGGSTSSVGGGDGNKALGQGSTVAGGHANLANGKITTISGGYGNQAWSGESTISGGIGNTANGIGATISGGNDNRGRGDYSVVAGGSGVVSAGKFSTASGGSVNNAAGDFSTVSGGRLNNAFGLASSIPGGFWNIARGNASLAAGWKAEAAHDRSFVWSSDPSQRFVSSAENQFLIDSSGGVGIGTNTTSGLLTVAGNVTPSQTSMHALGTPMDRWMQLFLAGGIDHDGPLVFMSQGGETLRLIESGSLEAPGTVTADGFIGDGSGLTGLNMDLLDGQVTAEKLADGAVTLPKLAPMCEAQQILRTVTVSNQIVWICDSTLGDQMVQSKHIQDGAVSLAKLSSSECFDNEIIRMDTSSSEPVWRCVQTLDGQIVQSHHIQPGAVSLAKLSSTECFDNEIIRMDTSSSEPVWRCVHTLDGQTVQSHHIEDGAVSLAKLSSTECLDNEIIRMDTLSSDPGWRCVRTLDGQTVQNQHIQDGAVSAAKLGEVCADGETLVYDETSEAWGCGTSAAEDTLAQLDCLEGQVVKFDSTEDAWICAEDLDEDTQYAAGEGLTLSLGEFALMSCADSQVLKATASGWACAQDLDEDTLGGLSCGHMEIARWTNDGLWFCSQDEDTTYSAGEALTLSGTEFALSGCPESQVLKATATGWACAVDESRETTSLPWSSITDKPAGFADDVDDVGITEESDPTVNDLAKAALACSEGLTVKYDGASWYCAQDLDEDTTYSAGDALALDGTEFSLDACPAGMVYKHDGGFWICSEDRDRLTSLGCAEHEIAKVFFGIPPDGGETLPQNYWGCAEDDSLEDLSCTSGEITRFDGSEWTCSFDHDTLYDAGDGIELEADNTFHVMPCWDRGILKSDGSSWVCEPDEDTLQELSCVVHQVPKMLDDDTWTCGMDLHTEYFAGEGLELDNEEFSLTLCSGDEILKSDSFSWFCSQDEDTLRDLACGEGQVTKAAADGTWQCSDIVTDPVWILGGNSGTDPELDYLGTNDQTPLQVRVDGQKVATFEVEGTVRMGSETVGEPAAYGTITRQVASRSTTSGVDVAVTDRLAFERDGTNGGFQVRTLQDTPAPQNVACQGITDTGGNANAYVTIPSGTSSGTVFQVYENADNVHRLDCSFGNPFGDAGEHYTSLELMRASGDFWWMGMVTSTTNQ